MQHCSLILKIKTLVAKSGIAACHTTIAGLTLVPEVRLRMSCHKPNQLFIMNFYTDNLKNDSAVALCARTTHVVKSGEIVSVISNNL